MKVKLARDIGFCSGVKRAFELVLKASIEYNSKEIYTLGPLIHNPQAVELLKVRGIREIRDIYGLTPSSIVVIRTHGISPDVIEMITNSGCGIVNATCPKVERVQKLVQKYINDGYKIILVGDKGHPEIEALLGYSDNKAKVVEDVEEFERIELDEKTCVLFQTTFDREKFNSAAEIIRRRSPETLVFDTLCNTTSTRQKELIELAKDVDAIVVVGGKSSANTRRLYEIAKRTGKPSFFVEKADEINESDFERFKTVGLTAGASTPSWIISEILEKLERIGAKSEKFIRWQWIKDIAYFVVQSKIFSAIGSIGITLLIMNLLGLNLSLETLIMPIFLILSFHTFEELNDWSQFPIGEFSKAKFFSVYKNELKLLGYASLFLSIVILILLRSAQSIIGFVLLFLGFLYANKLIPRSILKLPLREFFVTLFWTFSVILIPSFGQAFSSEKLAYLLPFFISLVLARALYSSIIDMKCDRVLSLDSLVGQIGERGTQTIIDIFLLIGSLFFFISIYKGIFQLKYYLLFLIPLYLAYSPFLFLKKKRSSGYALLLLDTFLYIAIVLSFILR